MENIVSGKTANGLEYISFREQETKNHPGGLRDKEDNSLENSRGRRLVWLATKGCLNRAIPRKTDNSTTSAATASQAIAVQNTAQSQSPLVALQQNQGNDEFATSINSPMSALNIPTRPGTVLSIFMDILPKTTSEKRSCEVFCKTFSAKVHVFRLPFFQNE